MVVTKKVSKRANVRNAVKRKVREIARLSFPRLRSGQNVIISVRSGALAADYQTLEKDLLGSFKRLGLFTDDK